MAVSIFGADGIATIDGKNTAVNLEETHFVGTSYLGESKAHQYRSLLRFNLFGAALDGRALVASDVIDAAELIVYATFVSTDVLWGVFFERISRSDWDYAEATWVKYNAVSNWTAGGGDVATPPAGISRFQPAVAPADYSFTGLINFVTDAIANRAGVVHLRMKADDEAPGVSQNYSADADPQSAQRPRLKVTYHTTAPAPVMRPGRAGTRPPRRLSAAWRRSCGRRGPLAPAARPPRRDSPLHPVGEGPGVR